jgi:two-component system sensor histidine kinase BarA
MIFSGIRNRILLVALAPAAMLALVLVTYLTNTRVQDLEQSLIDRGRAIATQLAPASQHGVLTGNRGELHRLARSAANAPDVVRIRIYDAERVLLVDLGADDARPPVGTADVISDAGGDTLSVASPILLTPARSEESPDDQTSEQTQQPRVIPPETVGHLTVDLSRASTQARQTEVILTSLGLTVLCLALAAGLGLVIGRSVIRPVLSLETAVQELRRGNLEARPEVRWNGELGSLARGVTAMAKSLRESHRFLQQQVEQATSEVRETMEELEVKNAELDIARRRALDSSRVKSEFLANMSHEIRTPMNGVLGFVELLEQTSLDDTQRVYLRTVRGSAEHLLELVNDILDLSKIEAGRLRLNLEPFDTREILENVAILFSANAHKKGLNLLVDVEPEVPRQLRGDRARIAQILVNLISNAVKFTEHGSVELHAAVDRSPAGDQRLVMSVSDTGIGISPKDQVRLFMPFQQVDGSSTRQQSGTGLGLAISRRLAELMGGSIELQSRSGAGASFTVSVPAPAVAETSDVSTWPDLGGVRVCLATQDDALARSVEHCLAPAAGHLIKIGAADALVSELDRAPEDTRPRQVILDALMSPESLSPMRAALNEAARVTALDLTILGQCGGQSAPVPWAEEFRSIVRLDKPPRSLELIHRLSGSGALPAAGVPITSGQVSVDRDVEPVTDETMVGESADAVLLADDNPINRRLASVFLKQMRLQVSEVADGREAIEACEQTRYGLILMDVHMPNIDGIEATRRIRESESGLNAQTPIVALTADALQDERDRFLRSGMDDHISKPITQSALKGLVDTWLGQEVERT